GRTRPGHQRDRRIGRDDDRRRPGRGVAARGLRAPVPRRAGPGLAGDRAGRVNCTGRRSRDVLRKDPDMTSIAPILSAGLVAGSLYALVASGLSFVWGTVRIFNFAQGALLMLGAYVAWYLTDPSRAGLGLGAAIPLTLVILGACGAVL